MVFYVPFNITQVISRRWKDDYDMLCANWSPYDSVILQDGNESQEQTTGVLELLWIFIIVYGIEGNDKLFNCFKYSQTCLKDHLYEAITCLKRPLF